MDIIFEAGRATAAEVMARMPDPPGYSAVRAMLRVLEDKGHLKHEQEGAAYTYMPTIRPDVARRSALSHVVRTFFDGSAERAVAALLESSQATMSREELDRLAKLIEKARREGR